MKNRFKIVTGLIVVALGLSVVVFFVYQARLSKNNNFEPTDSNLAAYKSPSQNTKPSQGLSYGNKNLATKTNTNAALSSTAIDDLSSDMKKWQTLLQSKPTQNQIRDFFTNLNFLEICKIMDYLCISEPELASAMFAYDIIPILKARWSADGQRWQDNAPYDLLLKLALDANKSILFRQVMIDIIGSGARGSHDETIRSRMAEGLFLIANDANQAEAVRVGTINKVGIMSPPEEIKRFTLALRKNVTDETAPPIVRRASIHALTRMEDNEIVPALQSICDDYLSDSDSIVARAAVVALSDFAQIEPVDAAPQIKLILGTTKDSSVYGSAVYAMSRLDSEEFVAGLPSIMEAQSQFKGDPLVHNSLISCLWARPGDVVRGLNSENQTIVAAAVQAATLVPLPPARPRLQALLEDASRSDHDFINLAIEKSMDETGYKEILNQNLKLKGKHYEE